MIELTDDNFESEVTKYDGVVLVDFWAPWCAPCQAIAPIIERIASEYEGKVKVCKFNVDNSPLTPSKYDIRAIPTLIFFKNGEVEEQITGMLPEDQIVEQINKIL